MTKIIHTNWSSKNWEIGRAITYVPRKFKDKTKKLRNIYSQVRPKTKEYLKDPSKISSHARKVFKIIKNTGFSGLIRHFDNIDSMPDYPDFHQKYYKLTQKDILGIKKMLAELEYKPLISIVMPVYNTNEKWLRKAIESIFSQVYPNWEFCIADDNSSGPKVKEVLGEYQNKDKRVKVVFRKENGHISEASNSALDIAKGEFIALLDHDDEFTIDALACLVYELNQNKDLQIIYSDEDKIDEKGNHSSPYFKSDWNPDLLFSHNFVSHLGIYKKSIVDEIGGFRKGYEGAQDWDLCLRVAEESKPDQIRHIPKVLYHKRMIEGPTASSMDSKLYASNAQLKVVSDAVKRRKLNADISYDRNHYSIRVKYNLVKGPLVSLIVPTKDNFKFLKGCLDSILSKTLYKNYEIIIIDNQGKDIICLDYLKELSKNPKISILKYNKPFNYSAINNLAVKEAKGEILAFVNNDTEVISPDWLTEMVAHALRPEIGAVGAKLYYPNNLIQHAGVITGIGGTAGHVHKNFSKSSLGMNQKAVVIQNFSAVTAACLVIKKSIFNEVDGFNETDLKVTLNDIDFCLKVREKGYYNLFTPYAELYHHESISAKNLENEKNKSRFLQESNYFQDKWKDTLNKDPFYNPNLTLENENFSLAHPPRAYKPWVKY